MLIKENFIHLKMTSERSKRNDFLVLVFILKSISKKLLIKVQERDEGSVFRCG